MPESPDNINKKILQELQSNARISNQDLSDRVGLSPTACARRIKQMEDSGLIKGYSAIIDQSLVGFGFTVFISVKLDRQIDERLHVFEREIKLLPEVADCWLMTGNRDYLLRIVLRDLSEFEHFLTGRLTKIVGVASIETSIPIRRVKQQMTRLD